MKTKLQYIFSLLYLQLRRLYAFGYTGNLVDARI